MITDFITEYLTKLLTPELGTPSDGVILVSVLISTILAYIPIHLILKPLVGEKIARYAFIALIVAMLIPVCGAYGVFVGV